MNICDRIRPELKAYADGQLPALSRLTIRWHLAHCADCRREVEEMERISNELREEEEPLAPALRARILAALPEGLPDAPDKPLSRPSWQRPLWFVGGGLVAAALAALFFLPRLGFWNSDDTGGAAQTVASPKAAGSSATGGIPVPAAGEATKENREKQLLQSPASGGANTLAGANAPAVPSATPGGMPGGGAMADGHEKLAKGGFGSSASDGGRGSFGGGAASVPGAPQSDALHHMASDSVDPEKTDQTPNHTVRGTLQPPAVMAAKPAIAEVYLLHQVHTDATLTLQVSDVAAGSSEVTRIGKAAGGSISPEKAKGRTVATEITLTVPSVQFESVHKQLAALGQVQSEKVNNTDLSKQIQEQEQAANATRNAPIRKENNFMGDNGGETQKGNTHLPVNTQSRGQSSQAKKPVEAEKYLRELKQSAAQATITVRLVEKPNPAVKK